MSFVSSTSSRSLFLDWRLSWAHRIRMAVRGLTRPICVDRKHLPSEVESDGVERLKRRTIIGRRDFTET